MRRTEIARRIDRVRSCINTCCGVLALAFLVSDPCVAAPEEGVTIGGTGAALGTMQLLAKQFNATNPHIAVSVLPSLGSSGGILAVLDGAIGIAVASRPISDSERKRGAVQIEYARSPFVFAISAEMSIAAITTRQLADIYAGKVTAWTDGSPLRVVLRPTGESDTVKLKEMSEEIRQAVVAAERRPGMRIAVTDQELADDLERMRGAIGPTTLALIISEKRNLRALALNGIEPTIRNAAAGDYPHVKRFFLITGGKRSPNVERFIAFVQSSAATNILAGNGLWIP